MNMGELHLANYLVDDGLMVSRSYNYPICTLRHHNAGGTNSLAHLYACVLWSNKRSHNAIRDR